VQDDKYPVLCQHAAQELFDEFSSVVGFITSELTGTNSDGPDLSGISYWFGIFVGSFPGIFCSGVDPIMAIQNQLGIPLGGSYSKGFLNIFKPLTIFPWFKEFQDIAKNAKDATSKGSWYKLSMYPMKPYDLFQNGNGWGQVWATINGNESLTTGAETGVDVAAWKWASPPDTVDTSGEKLDFAEAEFYYDCGPNTGPEAPGRNDTDGVWSECKYNAMWNMKWKARLRRYKPFEFDAAKMAELALYNSLGAESVVQKVLSLFPFAPIDPNGVGAKYGLIDSIKACLTSIGQGKSGDLAWGHCPFPMGGPKGGGNVTWPGNAPGNQDYDQVLH
jgi:hypothetical protein